MKTPKLKYWYLAMAAGNYRDFEVSRKIEISRVAMVNMTTGEVQGQTHVYLCESVPRADDNYRDIYKTGSDLYVLRIPRELIDRAALKPTERSGVWEYRKTLEIPHCGVERVSIKS